jgi:sterol desaturase/sphingolipid hydroxylase (fatty acid hydroxylase superfamily)
VDLITYSIPFFFLLMGVELVVAHAQGKRVYRGPDVATDLALGVLQVVFTVVAGGLLSFMYLKTYEYRLVTLPEGSAWVWALAFVGVDFCYYWFHRCSHRCQLAWATHAPHHSSEDYNLAVALRQGPIQPICSRFFYLPLALVGVPYGMFAVMVSINTLYQFWIHTELIGKVGPLEYIFNTPSHHRVHHGCNGKYLDKNHAGIFIIWDKLFGSFVPEAETPIYGTVKPAQTWNPITASLLPFADIAMKWSASSTMLDKLRAVFAPPEWLPPGVVAAAGVDAPRDKWDARPGRAVSRYVAVMFVQVLVASVGYIVAAGSLSWEASVVVAAWLTFSYGSIGALLDGKAFAIPLEIARFVVGVPVVVASILLL